jgi:sigma-B regulation protein RsbU (phosphoserine phosphatase)
LVNRLTQTREGWQSGNFFSSADWRGVAQRACVRPAKLYFQPRMESGTWKILLIGGEAELPRRVAELLAADPHVAAVTVEPLVDAGLALVATNRFDALVFVLADANTAALFQFSQIAARAPQLPLIVIGPDSGNFFAEAIFSGADEYLAHTELSALSLRHSLGCSVARHGEWIALMADRENYSGLVDHLVEGVFRTTLDGHYLLANAALARIYGYDSPADLRANIQDIATRLYVEPGRREEFARLMQANDTLTAFESRIYRKDGSIIWISENCRAVRDAQGTLLYYEGTVEDITLQRQMKEALRLSESLYHSLVETMPQGVFRRDLQGRFTFANQTYCNYHRVKIEDLLGKTDFDLYPKEAAQKYWDDDLQIMERGETVEITEETQPLGHEDKMYHHVIKTPLRDDNGKVCGLQGMIWDITEKKHMDDQIRRTTAELARSREELRKRTAIMEENLLTAREIQLALLPQQYPVFPKDAPPEKSALQFVHRYEAAESVSGDFFSVTQLSDTEAAILICDVTGHGTRAALVTAMIRALGEELKPLARTPGEFLRKLNLDLCAILKNTGTPVLTTAFYVLADCRAGTLRFANAGHPRPLLVRRAENRIEPLTNGGGKGQPALGLFEDPVFETTETTMAPGDFLMLFTDGLYEVQGQDEELYSQQRLMLDVKNLLHHPPAVMFDELIQVIRNFANGGEFEDDVCLVGMDYFCALGKISGD